MIPARPLFLVGFMGSGKSTVGRELASLAGRTFEDADRTIESLEGRSIEEIFRDSGEAHFRDVEARVVRGFAGRDDSVVALGGGAFQRADQRRWMQREGCTVWLDVTLEVARQRVGGGQGRPLWDANDALALRALFEQRRAVYALAAFRVDANGRPREVAEAIFGRFC